MFQALVLLPRNAFYRLHFDELNAILANAITNWRVATRLERAGGLPEAHGLRAARVLCRPGDA